GDPARGDGRVLQLRRRLEPDTDARQPDRGRNEVHGSRPALVALHVPGDRARRAARLRQLRRRQPRRGIQPYDSLTRGSSTPRTTSASSEKTITAAAVTARIA